MASAVTGFVSGNFLLRPVRQFKRRIELDQTREELIEVAQFADLHFPALVMDEDAAFIVLEARDLLSANAFDAKRGSKLAGAVVADRHLVRHQTERDQGMIATKTRNASPATALGFQDVGNQRIT